MMDFDVIVVGAGATGIASAIALAHAGLKVALIGPPDTKPNARTVALLDGSVQLLRNLGAWPALAAKAEGLAVMRLVDDTGSLFTVPAVDFCAKEIGLQEFGFNIENALLVQELFEQAKHTADLAVHEAWVRDIQLTPHRAIVQLESNLQISAALLIGADGRNSPTRAAAGVKDRKWDYPQVALTAILSHRRAHKNVSTEFHTRAGPCTLVPLPAQPDAPNRSSLVWMMRSDTAERRAAMDDGAFASAVEAQVHSLLGAMQIAGPRSRFPISGMVAASVSGARVALVGEAAHAFPPIGAQGLNLGMRDVAVLVDLVTQAHQNRQDVGGNEVLQNYERARRQDINLRTRGVDMLNRTLLADFLPADILRGAGLALLANLAPLRRAIMRQGLTPANLPPLMRALEMKPIRHAASAYQE